MARRHALWLDIRRSIARSKGRFLSIVGLMALGSFALVGLFVAGPDMRATGAAYFSAHGAADLTVIGDFGLNEKDCALIESADGIATVEYGYLKDAVIDGTDTSLRIQSAPEEVSRYELVAGRMPSAADEIALDSFLQDEYALGDTIVFDEKPDAQGETVLTRDAFTVVGFVNSTEMLSSVSFGESTAGSGELRGYAVVDPAAFDSDAYMTARLTFSDTAGLDPYGSEYADAVHAHRSELEELLADQPGARLAEIRSESQGTIDEGQAEVDAGRAELAETEAQLEDARDQLDAAGSQIAESERQLAEQSAAAQAQIDEGAAALAAGEDELEAGRATIEGKQQELDAAQRQIDEGAVALETARQELAVQQRATSRASSAGRRSRRASPRSTRQQTSSRARSSWWRACRRRRSRRASSSTPCSPGSRRSSPPRPRPMTRPTEPTPSSRAWSPTSARRAPTRSRAQTSRPW